MLDTTPFAPMGISLFLLSLFKFSSSLLSNLISSPVFFWKTFFAPTDSPFPP